MLPRLEVEAAVIFALICIGLASSPKQVVLKVRDMDTRVVYEFCAVQKYRSPLDSVRRPRLRPDGSVCYSRYLSLISLPNSTYNLCARRRSGGDANLGLLWPMRWNYTESEHPQPQPQRQQQQQQQQQWWPLRQYEAVHVRLDDEHFESCWMDEVVKRLSPIANRMVILGVSNRNLELSLTSKNLTVKVDNFGTFDHGYIILWALSFFVVFTGALWNRHEFWKSNQKAGNAIEKRLTPEIATLDLKNKEPYVVRVIINTLFERLALKYDAFNMALTKEAIDKFREIEKKDEDENKATRSYGKFIKLSKTGALNLDLYTSRTHRFFVEIENYVGCETWFVCGLIFVVIVTELISLHLFPIEAVRYLYAVLAAGCLHFLIYAFVEFTFFIRLEYPYVFSVPVWIRMIILFLAFILPVYYITSPIIGNDWYLQNLLGFAIALTLIGLIRIQRFFNIMCASLICLILIVALEVVSPMFNQGVSFSDSSLTHIFSMQYQRIVTLSEDGVKLPGMIWIPILSYPKVMCLEIDPNQYTFMGLIDIILPGFFMSYAISYDTAKSDRKFLYFSSNIITYLITMIITSYTFSLVHLTNSTVVTTVPALISLNILIAYLRQELADYMFGKPFKAAWEKTVSTTITEVCQKSKNVCDVMIIS